MFNILLIFLRDAQSMNFENYFAYFVKQIIHDFSCLQYDR